MKIKMNERIYVNRRLAENRARSESEDAKVQITGIRMEDESMIIRMIYPNEDVPLFRMKDAVEEICEENSEVYPQKLRSSRPTWCCLAGCQTRILGSRENSTIQKRSRQKNAGQQEKNKYCGLGS